MAINDITLANGLRQSLVQLQMTSALQARTTLRLSTGKRVNSAVDDPAAFFSAENNRGRANDLSARKNELGEAIQTVQSALQGVDGITKLIEQAKGLAASARTASTADRATLATQFDALRTQIDQLATDANYKGTNFLSAGTLVVNFNENGSSSLTVTGFDASSTGLAIGAAAGAWASNANIDTAVTDLTTGLNTLRTNAKGLSSNNGVITTRQQFLTDIINTLTTGADNLTAADPNEESANLLALQTRNQLGVVALQLSNQAQQAILKLF